MIAAHIFGFAGLAFIVAAWQFDRREVILWANVSSFLCFAVELYLLGALVGSIMMLTAAVTATTAVYTQANRIIVVLIVLPLLLSLTQLAHWYDVLTMLAHITGVLTFFRKTTYAMRVWAPIGTVLWAIHNVIVGAWGQLLADLFILSSMAVGALRHASSAERVNTKPSAGRDG